MDRRKSIKAIFVGTVSAGVLVEACNTEIKKAPEQKPGETAEAAPGSTINRMKEEAEYEKDIRSKAAFFTADEMATITILADIIIPKDDVSGSASASDIEPSWPPVARFVVIGAATRAPPRPAPR